MLSFSCLLLFIFFFFFFFFNDTATTEIYTLSLHDALPILQWQSEDRNSDTLEYAVYYHSLGETNFRLLKDHLRRSEEHTSELQSQSNLVCRLLLEKKKKKKKTKIKKKQQKTKKQKITLRKK